MEKFKLRVAVFLILIRDNKILLLRRQNTGWKDGNYSLPSGHLESGETVIDAVIREASEEIGVTVSQNDVQLVHTLHRASDGYIDLFFATSKWNGEIYNKEPNLCDDVSWFDLNKLPDVMIPAVKSAITKYQQGEVFSTITSEV